MASLVRALPLLLLLAGCGARPLSIEPPPVVPVGQDASASVEEPAASDYLNPPAVAACPGPNDWTLVAGTPCGPRSPCSVGCDVVRPTTGATARFYDCAAGAVVCVATCDECR